MKLIGSYTSPFVRKISVMLLEKGIVFEFVNESPYAEQNGMAQYNPLGKVPALVTDEAKPGLIRPSSRSISSCWTRNRRWCRKNRALR